MTARDYSSIWLQCISGAPKYGTDTTDKIHYVSSDSGRAGPSRNHTGPIMTGSCTRLLFVVRLFSLAIAGADDNLISKNSQNFERDIG